MGTPVTKKTGRRMDIHLQQMAEFVDFTKEDANLIRQSGPTILAHGEAITKAVYDHLLQQPGTHNFFRKPDGSIDEERIERRRAGLAKWLTRSAEANLDYAFAWHMVAMGIAHSHRTQKPMGKIPGSFMVGTMSFAQTAISAILWQDSKDKHFASKASIAWNKLLMLELDLILTGYYSVTHIDQEDPIC